MKKNIFYVLTFLIIGCSANEEIIFVEPVIRLNKINEQIKNENYLEALEDLKNLRLEYPASNFSDTVQFLIAECRFFREEYLLATEEYERLLTEMPQSPFSDDAKFKKALSYFQISPKSSLDQKFTINSIEGFQSFLESTKNDSLKNLSEEKIKSLNDKLANKIYENAEIYHKMNFLKSAIIYYDLVIEKFPDSKLTEVSMYKKIIALNSRKQSERVTQEIENFNERFPNSEFKNEILSLQK